MDVVLHLDMVTQKIDIRENIFQTFMAPKLVKLFDVTIKNIYGGASNNRIVRTTIEGVKEYTPMQLLCNGQVL